MHLKDKVIHNNVLSVPSEEPKKPGKSKYHNVKCEYRGISFDSMKERDYYIKLELLKRSGEITKIELQPEYPYIITYSLPLPGDKSKAMVQKAKYIGDFRITYPDGSIEVIDAKGIKTAIYRRKKGIIRKLYDIEIQEV